MKKLREIKVPLYAVSALIIVLMVGTYFGTVHALRWNNAGMQDKLREIDRIVEKRFVGDMQPEETADYAAFGYIAALGDRWSSYLPKEEYEQYLLNIEGNLVGIGVSVLLQEDGLLVRDVYPDSPAEQAGIMRGDVIVGAEELRAKEDGADVVTAAIAGEEGTQVHVAVRNAQGEENTLIMPRAMVKQKMIDAQMLDNKVGYIRIESFHDGVAAQFSEAVDWLLEDGAQRFIFDVRHNNGGRVGEMCDMLNRFLPEGRIMTLRTKDGKESPYDSDANMLPQPVVVLVDDKSISAAEFFGAALQEYKRATLVGTHTTGKGRAQQTFALSDGSAIVISTEQYFTPQNQNLADIGIAPDVEVALSEDALAKYYFLTQEEDIQLQTAISEVLKK